MQNTHPSQKRKKGHTYHLTTATLYVRREPPPRHLSHFMSPREPHVPQGRFPLPLQFRQLQKTKQRGESTHRHCNLFSFLKKIIITYYQNALRKDLTLYQTHLYGLSNPYHSKQDRRSSDFPCRTPVLHQHCMQDKHCPLDHHTLSVFSNDTRIQQLSKQFVHIVKVNLH